MAIKRSVIFKALWTLVPLFNSPSVAQVTLDSVPTTGCAGKPDGTASFTSATSVPTGNILINAGPYWNQSGATWEWILNTPGLVWYDQGGIPGYGAEGDIPAVAERAFSLSPDKSTITFSVPVSIGNEWDIALAGVPPTQAANVSSDPPVASSPTWTPGACTLSTFTDKAVTCFGSVQEPSTPTATFCACPSGIIMERLIGSGGPCSPYSSAQGDLEVGTNTCQIPTSIEKRTVVPLIPAHPEITTAPDVPFLGAKYRPRSRYINGLLERRDNISQMSIIFKGATPCAGPPVSSSTISTNPAIASSCSNGEITPGTAAFSTYEVQSYMSSLLSAAEPETDRAMPTAPVDGAAVIQSDVNPPGAKCTYTSQCDSIGCSSVKDYNTGSLQTVQRFLAYQTIVNFNNFLYSMNEALNKAGDISGLMSADIVTTFFTNPTPDVTWEQIVGAITPFLGLMATALGPLSTATSTALNTASGLLSGGSGGGIIDQLSATVDARFDEFGKISEFIGSYVETASKAIKACYDTSIGPQTNTNQWAGTTDWAQGLQTGLFGDGTFSDNDYTQSLTTNVQTAMAKIFAYKSINFALIDSHNFIMYVPYGRPVMGPDGNMIQGGIDQNYCQTKLQDSSHTGTILVCDAPGGMARVFNGGSATDASVLEGSLPQGWDSNLPIVPGETFNMGDAIKGSVASWQAGDFGYDASDPFSDTMKKGDIFSPQQLTQLAQLDISQSSAGFFNLPVCQLYDLRGFPPASGLGCTACHTSVSVGGTKGSTVHFWDKVDSTVQNVLESAPNGEQCAGSYGCADTVCNFDPYTG